MANYHRWTDDEVDLLLTLYGTISVRTLCTRLGVSHNTLRNKCKALGLGYQRDNDVFITMRQLRSILRVGHYTMQRFIANGLPVKKIIFGAGKRYNIVIHINSLMDWLEANPDMWDSCRVDRYALGSEPQWLIKKRKTDYKSRWEGINEK